MKDYNIQHKGVGEGDKVGINQKIGDKRKSRCVMFTRNQERSHRKQCMPGFVG